MASSSEPLIRVQSQTVKLSKEEEPVQCGQQGSPSIQPGKYMHLLTIYHYQAVYFGSETSCIKRPIDAISSVIHTYSFPTAECFYSGGGFQFN